VGAGIPNNIDLNQNGSTNGANPAGFQRPELSQALPPAIPIPPEERILGSIPDELLVAALVKRGKNGGPSKIELTEAEEASLAEHIIEDFQDSDSLTRQFKLNQLDMLANWRGTPNDKDLPFEGASNIHVPLTSSYIETMKSRLIKAIFGDNDRIVEIQKIDEKVDQDKLEEMNQWFAWELREIIDIKKHLSDILHNVLVNGIGISVPSYRHETRMLHSRTEKELPPDAENIGDLVEAVIHEILEQKSEWGIDEPLSVTKQTKPGIFELSDGGRIEFSIDQTVSPISIIADVWKREIRFDGVKTYCVNLEDLVVVNSGSTVDELPFFGIRVFFDAQQYREGLQDKYFIDYGEEKNKEIWATADIKIGEYIDREQTRLQDEEEGTDSMYITGNEPRDKYLECYRWEGWWGRVPNPSKDGEDFFNSLNVLIPASQYIVHVAPQAKKIIRIERLEDHNKDGKRSGIKYDFITEPNRFYSMGLAEWVRHSQAELDAIHNQRLDAGLLTNLPYGFYKPTSGIKPQIIKVEPGKLWPVADPQGVNFPKSNWMPTFSFQEEALVKRYAGEQAGLSDPATGQFTSKRTSASEFVGTAAALDLRTEDIVEGIVRSFREELLRILGLYQQYGPSERIFRAGGAGGVELTKRFKKDRLNGKILLKLTANLQQINESLQRQLALDMLQLLLNEILIQTGIVGPDTIYQAIMKLVKLSHYTGVTLHEPNTPPLSDPPNVENHQMNAGEKPKGPTIGENFSEHLQVHSMLAANSEIMNQWAPASRMLLQSHIQETIQMQQAAQVLAQQRAAMATQMAGTMAEKGIRPGKAGGQNPTDNTGAGTAAEGVESQGPASNG
jgi:hypothetical protein